MKVSNRIPALALLALMALAGVAADPNKIIALYPTDDAYVVADTSNEADPQGLRAASLGGLGFVRTWYAWHAVGEEQIVAISLLRFDLETLKGREIKSAQLQMYSTAATLSQPARLVDVNLVTQGDWDQAGVTYNNRPSWSPNALATTAVYGPGVWYSWDVSAAVAAQAKRGGPMSLAIGLRAIDDKSEEQVLFASTELEENAPRMIVEYASAGFLFAWYDIAIAAGVLVVVVVGAFVVGRSVGRARAAKSALVPAGAGSGMTAPEVQANALANGAGAEARPVAAAAPAPTGNPAKPEEQPIA